MLNFKNSLSLTLSLLLFFYTTIAYSLQTKEKDIMLLEISLNHAPLSGIYTCYVDKNNHVYVDEETLSALHIPKSSITPWIKAGKNYFSLSWFKEVTYSLDQEQLKLNVNIPPNYLPINVINFIKISKEPIRPTQPGSFLNYDLTKIQNHFAKTNVNSGWFELGTFNHAGVGIANMLVSNYNALNSSQTSYQIVRLNSSWTLDEPEKMASWRFGDSITGSSNWSGAARFGGIQYATNFNTQPSFITFPLPGYRGAAYVPSNLEVYVNGVLNQKKSVADGTYLLNNIPVVTGAGTVNVVTQDLLGRTQNVALNYYTSPVLLKPGLDDYSYEVGFIRQNYGINSNDYKDFLGTFTYQHGYTDHLTLGTHGEWLAPQKTWGVSANYLFKQIGVFSVATATSISHHGNGWLGLIGFNRQTPSFNFGFQSQYMSANYQQLGLQSNLNAYGPTSTNQIFFGYSIAFLGSLGISYTMTKQYMTPLLQGKLNPYTTKLTTISYNRGLWTNSNFTLSAIHDFKHSYNNQYYLAISVNFDSDHNINMYVNTQNQQTQPGIMLSKNLPLGTGYGYHILASNNGVNGSGADVTYQGQVGSYTARAYNVTGHGYYEGDINGAIVWMDDQPFFSRQITESFAIAQVPGYENVRVYYQNQLMGRTNRYGDVLIPQILPYQDNKLTIEPLDLPLNSSIKNTSVNVIPYYRSGVLATFNVKKNTYLLLKLTQSNGSYVPLGAVITLSTNQRYKVGYDGEVFIDNMPTDHVKGQATWKDHTCHFEIINKKNNLLNRQSVNCY